MLELPPISVTKRLLAASWRIGDNGSSADRIEEIMMKYHTVGDLPLQHDAADLIAIFNRLFRQSENTRLERGDKEPIYLPAGEDCCYHRVVFAHGFFASALHEIAHWCIAGKHRRQQEDYGYWYAPDGRNAAQQKAFEKVEVAPQALEWILSKTCAKPFSVSIDNLNGVATDTRDFKQAVFQRVHTYCRQGLPARAEALRIALADFYGTAAALDAGCFTVGEIGLEVLEGAASA